MAPPFHQCLGVCHGATAIHEPLRGVGDPRLLAHRGERAAAAPAPRAFTRIGFITVCLCVSRAHAFNIALLTAVKSLPTARGSDETRRLVGGYGMRLTYEPTELGTG
jgi:hypothetical protein